MAGLWSHLASPEDATSSQEQVRRFEGAAEALRTAGLAVPARHIAASGGIFSPDAPWLDMVRPGLATYGVLDKDLPIAREAATAAAQPPSAFIERATRYEAQRGRVAKTASANGLENSSVSPP
ncbi:MAG: alanine racemase [Candidatus Binatia bacterium]